MKIKLNLGVLAISFALFLIIDTGDVFAQSALPKVTPKIAKDSHGKFRVPLIEDMLGEAKKIKLELNEKALTVISRENLLTAFMPIAGSEKLTEENFQKGAVTGLAYIESTNKARIPNGYYKVQLTSGPRNSNNDTREKLYTLSLIDWEGKVQVVTDTFPQAWINYRDRVLYLLWKLHHYIE